MFEFQLDILWRTRLVPIQIQQAALTGEKWKALIELLARCGSDFDFADAGDIRAVIFHRRFNFRFGGIGCSLGLRPDNVAELAGFFAKQVNSMRKCNPYLDAVLRMG